MEEYVELCRFWRENSGFSEIWRVFWCLVTCCSREARTYSMTSKFQQILFFELSNMVWNCSTEHRLVDFFVLVHPDHWWLYIYIYIHIYPQKGCLSPYEWHTVGINPYVLNDWWHHHFNPPYWQIKLPLSGKLASQWTSAFFKGKSSRNRQLSVAMLVCWRFYQFWQLHGRNICLSPATTWRVSSAALQPLNKLPWACGPRLGCLRASCERRVLPTKQGIYKTAMCSWKLGALKSEKSMQVEISGFSKL